MHYCDAVRSRTTLLLHSARLRHPEILTGYPRQTRVGIQTISPTHTRQYLSNTSIIPCSLYRRRALAPVPPSQWSAGDPPGGGRYR